MSSMNETPNTCNDRRLCEEQRSFAFDRLLMLPEYGDCWTLAWHDSGVADDGENAAELEAEARTAAVANARLFRRRLPRGPLPAPTEAEAKWIWVKLSWSMVNNQNAVLSQPK